MPDKDFQTLLGAARLLADRRDDFQLALVGRGTEGAELASAICEAGVDHVVATLGPRRDVPAILAAADVFVLSSKRETFGLAPLEAMAAGVPVVASDLPALDDLFTDGREGLKVPPGDPEALAAALARLLDDIALARRLGGAGRERAKRFGTEPMVRRFERLLCLVCSDR
jgi:glycosyltransferase involved in cell wall biosynthesis